MLHKESGLINQKWLAVYACPNRDVFAGFSSSRKHNLLSKVNLRQGCVIASLTTAIT